jgi:signal transduction histidine kinase
MSNGICATGKHTGFSKILRDMTDRKQAQEKLQQQAQALREADRSKDEFLAMLAHELRNPLAPIRTCLDRMRLKVPPDSPLHPVLDVVERQLGQMTRLVDDLLDVSRITRGKIKSSPVICCVATFAIRPAGFPWSF